MLYDEKMRRSLHDIASKVDLFHTGFDVLSDQIKDEAPREVIDEYVSEMDNALKIICSHWDDLKQKLAIKKS